MLDDISEMSGNLREWEFERDVQKRLNDHIKKLREELRLAEEQLQQQKEKMSAIQPRVSLYHEQINSGRKECFRLSKICNSLGQRIQGSNYEYVVDDFINKCLIMFYSITLYINHIFGYLSRVKENNILFR